MRPLEILLPIVLCAYLVTTFFRPRAWVAYFAAGGAVLQVLLEGYRWQMVPLYTLTTALLLTGVLRRKNWAVAMPILMLVVLLVSVALPVLLPIPSLPKTSGTYPVGTTIITLTDTSRKELYSGKDEPRRFQVQIWYPSDPQAGDKKAPWVNRSDIYAPVLANNYNLPPFFLDHLSLLETPAFVDAPLAASEVKFPIAVFSHGWTGFSAQNSGQAIELASNGYVVMAMQHTFGAIVTVFPDGTVAPYNPAALPKGVSDAEYLAAARELVNQWSGDIAFALDYLAQQETDPSSRFYARLDFDRIGVFGHSTGGGAAIEFCGTDTRCKAVYVMDPYMIPVSEHVMENGISQPAFFMFSEAWHTDSQSKNNSLFGSFFTHVTNSLGVVYVKGSHHTDFGDLPMLSPIAPQLGLKGPINGQEMTKINFAYVLQFFDLTLMEKPTSLLNGPTAKFPEVNFFTPPAP